MQKLGSILNQGRRNKGVSLQEASEILKIKKSTLESIEKGEKISDLRRSYLRGFVGSYAAYLDLNKESILELFKVENGVSNPQIDSLKIEASKWKSVLFINRLHFDKKKLSFLSVLALLFFVIGLKELFTPEVIPLRQPSSVSNIEAGSESDFLEESSSKRESVFETKNKEISIKKTGSSQTSNSNSPSY